MRQSHPEIGSSALPTAGSMPAFLPQAFEPRNMAEEFTVNLARGTVHLRVPLTTSRGRQGFAPSLALEYDNGIRNGLFGTGWSLPTSCISRKTKPRLPRYLDHEFGELADTFGLSDCGDLLPAYSAATDSDMVPEVRDTTDNGIHYLVRRYRPRIESAFARIERWDTDTGAIHWRRTDRDNITEIYGASPASRIADPTNPLKVFAWLLEERRDDRGNILRCEYRPDDALGSSSEFAFQREHPGPHTQRILKRIQYGNTVPFEPHTFLFEVVFDYGDHPGDTPPPTPTIDWPERRDSFSDYRAGFEIRTRRLCQRILMYHHFEELGSDPVLVRSTRFGYQLAADFTQLVKIQSLGHIAGRPDLSLPPLEFEYTTATRDFTIHTVDAAQAPPGMGDIVRGARALASEELFPFSDDPESVPRQVDAPHPIGSTTGLDYPTEQFHLVDMSGDRLIDLVRIRNGEICYWPNLGKGRFGRLVRMDNSPRFDHDGDFDPSRLRLADIEGTGYTDLIYLEPTRIMLYRNLSGNAWSSPIEYPNTFQIDDPSSFQIMDFLGKGTACLVWPSPLTSHHDAKLCYLDFAGGKPHLLRSVRNNLGSHTQLTHEAAPHFFRADQTASKPWLLAFPRQQVIARSVTKDAVNGSILDTRYTYRHGAYDVVDREFCGFGHVQQQESESFEIPVDGISRQTRDTRTVTWFHTAPWPESKHLLEPSCDDFFGEEVQSWSPPGCLLPDDLPPKLWQQAYDTLNGKPHREEVYTSGDRNPNTRPDSVIERFYALRLLQSAAGDHPHSRAAFFPHLIETRTILCDPETRDLRIHQELNWEIDHYGFPLRKAVVVYPRRPTTDHPMGSTASCAITITHNNVIHQDTLPGPHRLGILVATTRYALVGAKPPDRRSFSTLELEQALAQAASACDEPSATGLLKRLLEAERFEYYDDNFSNTPLPLGSAGKWALPFQSWVAADAMGLDASLLAHGGYQRFATNGGSSWWARSVRTLYDRQFFLLPVGSLDAWDNLQSQAWDRYGLLVTSYTDGAQNTVLIRNHYRVLAPWMTIDSQQNRSAVRFDALGRVIATAQSHSAPQPYQNDTFVDSGSIELTASDVPETLLHYDHVLVPARIRVWTRREPYFHAYGTTSPYSETRTYFDGMGRKVLTKIQLDPTNSHGPDNRQRQNDQRSPLTPTNRRWVGTDRLVYDHLGQVVKHFEPYFTDTADFETESELAATGVLDGLSAFPRQVRANSPKYQ